MTPDGLPSSDLIAPFYKGLVRLSEPASLALITRRDPATDAPMSADSYLRLINEWNEKSPELIQNIVRCGVAALLAARLRAAGRSPRLISVEGCVQAVGGRAMTGAQIVESIWWHVLPRSLTDAMPPPIIRSVSDCTVNEVRALFAHAREDRSSLHAVTHSYHAPRVERALRELATPGQELHVYTPEGILAETDLRQGSAAFIGALTENGALPASVRQREERRESYLYRPLHGLSRVLRTVTGGSICLESWLAGRVRERQSEVSGSLADSQG